MTLKSCPTTLNIPRQGIQEKPIALFEENEFCEQKDLNHKAVSKGEFAEQRSTGSHLLAYVSGDFLWLKIILIQRVNIFYLLERKIS